MSWCSHTAVFWNKHAHGKKLKSDLRVNINYRAVNPYVWYLFFINYGGVVGSI